MSDYIPREGSLPAAVCGHFQLHPDDTLSIEQISQQFGGSRNSVHTNLGKCVEAGLLRRVRNDETGYSYQRGTQLKAANAFEQVARHPKPTPPVKADRAPPAAQPDPTQVPIDLGVPLPQTSPKVRWSLLLDRLSPGASAKLPLAVRGSLRSAVGERQRHSTQRFAVRKVDAEHLRIWRTDDSPSPSSKDQK